MMHPPTTLKGVFPERPVIHRKNFIKENVRRIRQLQSEHHEIKGRTNKEVNKRKDTNRGSLQLKQEQQMVSHVNSQTQLSSNARLLNRRPGIQKLEIKPAEKVKEQYIKEISELEINENITHRSMQTEHCDDPVVLYATGVIKYPTPVVQTVSSPKKRPLRREKREIGGNGDSPDVSNKSQDSKIDYVRSNMLALKSRSKAKAESLPVDPNKAPENYKRGVMPKYIKNNNKKEGQESADTADVECPPGHVLLPEEERKETLRVLRESYAEKVQEVNLMPVRSDTLRMQKRKMELEMELKKIDEGIKVFQRPKVFVKINV